MLGALETANCKARIVVVCWMVQGSLLELALTLFGVYQGEALRQSHRSKVSK